MNVCVYLRKSRADRDHPDLPLEDVLRNHEAMLLAYAAKTNLQITNIKKEVVSGESLARRPEMLRLLEEVEDGLYDAVLVKDFDRLGRGNMLEQGIIIEAFRKSGTKIITPDKTYDLENEFDEEYIDLSAFFARKELKMITKRLHSGRMKSVSDGNYISPYAPYGYDRNHKSLTINEKEKDVVRIIFDLYVNQGFGDSKIARHLTSLGVPSKQGGTHWDKTTIRNLLRNPVYIGKIAWNKREYRYQGNGKRSSSFLNRSNWKIFEGRHEAIIEDDLFAKAQLIAEKNSVPHLPAEKILRNPLSNLIRCGGCGGAMTIRTAAGRKDTLRCYRHCGGVMGSYLSSVENRMITLLDLYFLGLEIKFLYSESEKTGGEHSVLIHALESCEARKKKLLMQRNSIHDLLEQGVYSNATFLARLKSIDENLMSVEVQAETVRKQLSIQYGINRYEGAGYPKFRDLRGFIQSVYPRLDAENKNAFLRELVHSAVYHKTPGSGKDGFTLEIDLKD